MKTNLRYLMSYLRAMEYSLDKMPAATAVRPVITFSRQKGAMGTLIAGKTAEFLTLEAGGKQPWAVVDKELVDEVIGNSPLCERISRFLSEEKAASVRDRVEEMLGLQPSRGAMVAKLAQVTLDLAEIGHVIFVGRAANVITARLPQAYHVRIVGSLENRVVRVAQANGSTRAEARAFVRKMDADRASFVSNYFQADIDDSTGYDLTINTDRLTVEKAVSLITRLLPSSGKDAAMGEKSMNLHTLV